MERLGTAMTAKRRYQIAFFALGWLLLLGIVFQTWGRDLLRRGYGSVEERLLRAGQKMSDAEGDAWQRVNHGSRREQVRASYPHLDDRGWLTHPDRLLYGAYDGGFPASFSGLGDLENQLHTRFPIVSFYQAWGDQPDQATFPLRTVETIDRLGSVPMITWEPWVKDFDETRRTNLPPLAQREYASLAAIAHGDYDFYITAWAQGAAHYGKPLFLRFAHEMNDPYRYPWGPQNGNRPDDFIAAWKHVHLVFQKMSAANVLWVWSPHISMPWFEYYYPGDEWVDWIGTGVLNYGDVATWSRWWTFHQIVEKAWPALVKLHKPVMITEFGTLSSGGDAAEWYSGAFRDIREKYQATRAVVFFNQTQDVTLSTKPLDWSPLRSATTVRAVSAAIAEKTNR